MGRKTNLDDPILSDGTTPTMDKHARSPDGERPTPEVFSIYLREIGAIPLIERDRELELAREFQDAREALAKLVLRLPQECRDQVLAPAGPRRGREWPLDQIQAFYSGLLRFQKEHRDPSVAGLVREAASYKRRLDHAHNALILANLRLVVYLAKKYVKHGMPLMDLIQEGNVGLMKAVEKFKYELDHKFSTYAYWWIKQAIQRAIADKARMIRIPVHINEKIKKVSRVAGELAETLGRSPTPQEIAKKLQMPEETVEQLLNVVQDPQTFEGFSSKDERPGLLWFVADPNAPDPLERTREQELKEKIEQMLKVLDPREEKIIRLRFGIGQDERYTLEEIGRGMCLSRERVRQIEAIALRKIHAIRECWDLRALIS